MNTHNRHANPWTTFMLRLSSNALALAQNSHRVRCWDSILLPKEPLCHSAA
jgi:hypothetical protein